MGGTQLKFLFPTYHDPTKYWQVGLLHGELENQVSTQWLCRLSGVLWFPPGSSTSSWEERPWAWRVSPGVLEAKPAGGTHFLPYSTAQSSSMPRGGSWLQGHWDMYSSWESPERRGETHLLETTGLSLSYPTTANVAADMIRVGKKSKE